MKAPSVRCVGQARRSPTVRTGIVSATGVQNGDTVLNCASPHDHFVARPHSAGPLSAIGRVSRGSGCPTVGDWIVSPAGVRIALRCTKSTPHNHFGTTPYRCVSPPSRGHVRKANTRPTVGHGIVSAAAVIVSAAGSAPDDHFTASPNCGVRRSCLRYIDLAGRYPTVRARCVPGAGVERAAAAGAAPDDHFAPSPHCSVIVPR